MIFNADGSMSGGAPVAKSGANLSWLQRNLNSIGGGGGAVAGGLTGATIGSAFPVVGTAIGGIIGAGLGGLAGGVAGEAGKQSAEGNVDKGIFSGKSGNEIRNQGLIQGTLGAGSEFGGQVIGRGISSILGKVAGKGADIVANPVESLLTQGAKAPSRVTGLGTSEVQRILDTAPETAKTLTKLGATSPEKIAGAADLTTGKTGYLNSFVRRFVDAGGAVDVTKAQGAADTALSNLTDPVAKREVAKNITDILGKLKLSDNPISGDVLGKSAPGHVFDAIQVLDEHMASSDSKPAISAYKAVKGALENSLYKEGGADAVAAGYKLGPEEAAQILADAKQAGLPKVGQHIIDTVNNAQDIGTLRSAQAPFVNAGKAAQGFERNTVGTTGLLNNAKQGKTIFQIGSAPLRAAMQSPIVDSLARVTGKTIEAPARLAQGAIEGSGDVLGRAAAQGAVRLSEMGNTQPAEAASGSVTPTRTTPTDTSADTTGTFSPAVLQAMALHDIQTTGGKNIEKISTLASLFGPNGKTTAGGGTVAQKNQQLAANNALAILDNVENNFQATGGGKGALGGRLAELGTRVNINANLTAYDKNLTDTATALAKAITGSARPAASVIEQYRQSLPMATDSPEVASSKLQQLRDNVQSLLQTSSTSLAGIQ